MVSEGGVITKRLIQKIEPTIPIQPRLLRVAAYARVSSGKDAMLHSLSAQVSYYNELIQGNPEWLFCGIYADEALTGTKSNRAEFQKMLTACRNGEIDLIITKSISRFARNTVTLLETVRELKDIGVDVYFEKENIYTLDSKGELLITIMSSLAQEESRSISENVTWGQRKRMADGKVSLPYGRFLGYRKGENGLPEIVPEEAEIVRFIYRSFMHGSTPHHIAETLTFKNILTPGGKEVWTTSTIESIHNDALILSMMDTAKKLVKDVGRISCDVSESVRACKLEVKSGTAATSPSIPVFENTESKKFLTVAAVYLKGGAKTISSSNIRDMRADEKKCGYVKCVLGKCRVSEMLVATELMTNKMNEMVGKIDALQSAVDTLQLKVDDLTGDIVSTGSLGKNIYYVLYSNGNVLVRGSGEMYDYDLNNNLSPIFGNNEITSVVVSGSVTYIGDYIFGNCRNMQKITLPNTLTSIGDGAFMQGDGYANTVYGLTEITIPSKVTTIGENAFLSSAIQSLVIPASVTEIGKYSFRDCAALKSVTINNSVIGEFMFVNCSKLSSFIIGIKLKKIGSNVFNYCSNLETITYNGTLAKWQEIEKGSNWDGRSAMEPAQSGLLKIQCTDGYMEYADGVWKEVKA